MTFNKKTIIIVVSSVAGVILLSGIIAFAFHPRYIGRGNERGFNHSAYGKFDCGNTFAKGNPARMMSGIENIITTKDYTAFQTLFSGTHMAQNINTPEKFATRVELQSTIEHVQALQTKLGSGDTGKMGPMMMFGGKQNREAGKDFMGRKNMRKRGGIVGCY